MEETKPENGDEGWKKFIRKHRGMFALFVLGVAIAAVGAVYVFLWFVGNAQSTGMIPATLGLWTMGNLVTFILYAVFWELLLIGVPVGIAAIIGWLWWRKLPEDEKKEYHFGKSSRTADGGGAVSFLFFIAFCIKVYIDGNWNVAISTWALDYAVYSMLWIVIWGLAIFGIPAAIIGIIWWARHEMKKT